MAKEVCHMVVLGWYIGDSYIMGEVLLHSPHGSVEINGVEKGNFPSEAEQDNGQVLYSINLKF